ncbi:MAG: MT-A70 family methyltransferase [Nitrospiraceae bacterium]
MVAYSFKSRFLPPIARGLKRQTIRAPRSRHARPGERLQLYAGMRTRHCYKIIPDPVCLEVCDIELHVGAAIIDDIGLVARIGRPQARLTDVPNVIIAPGREHSRKPDDMRAICERLSPHGPRCELFAREAWPGNEVWGNETGKFEGKERA